MTDDKVVPLRSKNSTCPMCAKPTVDDYRPFCSKRCADRDLGKWLKEDYRMPSDEQPGFDGEPIEED
ncbi:MAG: DNA gyrase inhibitor YacG [Rhodospirillaceae bacterium]|jgi:uncharacterized protein|nr:DNA gyrase inhibitor YacG [Rhodospirillaceae bacterium]MBT4218370.1 DNA gyrase inhibitor YacG [Rhodospirillaceae bacterium]MBT4463832.1 DNA gyrase inhibitor YacG [Rhodospirillaceae bacterium]MBT5013054.1 DNA gyrase inhibitor YacG [Rhodospirillaceae bacterium]MBT5308852.1 DNA gyrase inhibitor YacG [Rhodospirillaceae bacterium]